MNFNVVPPLTFTSALSVTVSLYYNADIQTYKERALSLPKAIAKVHALSIPDVVKDEIFGLLQPIAKEIVIWLREFHNLLYDRIETNYVNLYQKLSWKPLGTIDYQKTGENCILSGSLSDVQAFVLACSCGEVGHIFRLWPIVRSKIQKEISAQKSLSHKYTTELWVMYLKNQLAANVRHRDEEAKFMLKNAVDKCAIGTAEFFMQRLNPQLKKTTISELVVRKLRVFWYQCDVNIVLLLLSQLDDESIKELFISIPVDILHYFLEWPLQQFFIPLTEMLWDVFPFTHLHVFFDIIRDKVLYSLQPWMYKDIHKALWLKIPVDEQAIFFDREIVRSFLNELFNPYTTEYAISQLYKEQKDALNKFRNKLLSNVSSVTNILLGKNNLHEVVKDFLQQHIPKEDLIEDFDRLYAIHTRVYTNVCNGIHRHPYRKLS